jgi:hypothetical protein
MAEPNPSRGICQVSDIERLLRPQNKAQDFRYSDVTHPSRRDVCDEIDMAYDELALLLRTDGINIPMYDPLIKNYAIILNALLAASNIENETHTSTKPNITAWGKTLSDMYEKKLKFFLKEAYLPQQGAYLINGVMTVYQNLNSHRPMVYLHEAMFSTMAELYDEAMYDTAKRQAFFRVDKEY